MSSSIVVNITHSDNIEFWKRSDAAGSLEHQAKFVEAGGVINRIIQGDVPAVNIRDAIDAQSGLYREIIEEMRGHRINVFYIQNRREDDRRYDFAWVKMHDVADHPDMAMLWYVTKAVFSQCDLVIDESESDIMSDLRTRWDALMRRVNNTKDEPMGDNYEFGKERETSP